MGAPASKEEPIQKSDSVIAADNTYVFKTTGITCPKGYQKVEVCAYVDMGNHFATPAVAGKAAGRAHITPHDCQPATRYEAASATHYCDKWQ